MFCENCGKELENGSLFCSYCGKKTEGSCAPESFGDDIDDFQSDYSGQYEEQRDIVSDSSFYGVNAQPAPQEYSQSNYNYQPAPVNPPEKKKGLLIGVIIAGVAVVIAIVAAVLLFSGDTNRDNVQNNNPDSSQTDGASEEEDVTEVTGNTRILSAYDEGGILAPEKLYNDVDYYVSWNIAALYKESGGYARGQTAQLETNDVVTVKGAMEDSNWVYVYCKELDIYGWIEPSAISASLVDSFSAKADKREVIYYSDNKCYDALVSVGRGHNLNLRNIPSSVDDSTVVRMVSDGERVRVLGVSAADGDWYYVCYDSFDYGKLYGFMSGEYLAMYRM